MFRRFVPAFALASVLAVAVGSIPSASVADTMDDGNWWYSAYHVAQAHAAGWTGKGVKIAVIDGEIDSSLPVFKGTNLDVDERSVCSDDGISVTGSSEDATIHASTIAALLVGNGQGAGGVQGISPGADLMYYGGGTLNARDPGACSDQNKMLAEGITRAVDGGANIISISFGAGTTSDGVVRQVARAVARGVVIVAAQADTVSQGIAIYPDGFNGVVAVNAADSSGNLMTDDETGKPNQHAGTNVVAAGVNVATPYAGRVGTGTSFAAPLVAGMLADVWQKYPKATGNELIRSLLHNANKVTGEDGIWYGSGIASMTNMLKVDPAKYANSNPLWGKEAAAPTRKQVDAYLKPDHRASVSARASARAVAGSTGRSTAGVGVSSTWAIPLIAGIVILIAVVVVLFLVWRRKRTVGGGSYGRKE